MGKRLIYSERDLTQASDELLKSIDKAVLAAAFSVRDEMRSKFLSSSTKYKHGTSEYSSLAEGIMVGKLRDSKVKVHALGSKSKYNTFKTRFFVGGTLYRTQKQVNGKSIKPYSKGYIQSNDAVRLGLSSADQTLNKYIKNVISN